MTEIEIEILRHFRAAGEGKMVPFDDLVRRMRGRTEQEIAGALDALNRPSDTHAIVLGTQANGLPVEACITGRGLERLAAHENVTATP